MNTKLENNNLTLYLEDRVDANNAPAVDIVRTQAGNMARRKGYGKEMSCRARR